MSNAIQQDTNHTEKTVKEIQFSNAEFLPQVVQLMNEGHTVTLNLKGFSMRPFLEDGRDKALLTKTKELHIGDAVLAEISPKHFVLHRIVGLCGERVILRGDGNLATEQCDRDHVWGTAIGFYRKGRKVLDRTDGLKWRVYSVVWMKLYPIRRYLLAAYRRIWLRFFKPM